jgi:hypothetical protein
VSGANTDVESLVDHAKSTFGMSFLAAHILDAAAFASTRWVFA